MKYKANWKGSPLYILLLLFFSAPTDRVLSQAAGKTEAPFTIENFYKIRWGHAEEFISLWKSNHYPLLKKALEKGDIIRLVAEKPLLHSGEDTRWDFRVTIVFKNSRTAFDATLLDPYKPALYPDDEKLKRDEVRRFELLLSHSDVMTEPITLD